MIETISNKKREKRYFVLNNFQIDYRKLVSLSEEDFKLAQTSAVDAVNIFESKLNYYATYLINHGIPFDVIDVTGESGIVINSKKYNEIMETYILDAYDDEKSGLSLDYLEDEYGFIDDAFKYLSEISIKDTPSIVPIKFEFKPWFITTQDNILLKSTYYTGHEDIDDYTFKLLVNFDEFAELLNKRGYQLVYTPDYISTSQKAYELNNYQEYFKCLFENNNNVDDRENEKVYIRVRFNANNK